MKQKTFDRIATIVYDEAGIVLKKGKEALVKSRLSKRMRSLNINTYEEYLDYLIADKSGTEMILLLDVISTNLTSFYRESTHFTLFSEYLNQWLSEGQRRLRVWCAAASTGEEPYTIAMTASECIQQKSVDFKILATDISTKVLKKCVEGIYTDDRIQSIPKNLRLKYFKKESGTGQSTLYSASSSIKSQILFRRLNLVNIPYPMKGPMDVVFCRNVMIYFDNSTRAKIIQDITRLLKPGGILFIGHSESLTALNTSLKAISPAAYIKI